MATKRIKTAAVDVGVCQGIRGSGAVYAVAPTSRGAARIALRESRTPDAMFDLVPISDEAAAFVAEHGGAPDDRLLVSRSGVTLAGNSLPTPTVHDPATYWQAVGLGGEGRTRAGDYVCYAPGAPSNGSSYGPGRGATERQALLAACYWANHASRIRVVPARQAPQWAIDQAADRAARK
jgi:hypothetical protein